MNKCKYCGAELGDYIRCSKCNKDRPFSDLLKSRQAPAPGLREAEYKKALVAIRDYEPHEICKDEFAYDRMIEAYRNVAKAALEAEKGRG